MAFIAGLVGMLGRFAGKILTTTLGWASVLLFGRVPQNRQVVLALITFGSVVWAALVIGVVLPTVGTLLVAAVPAPEAVDRGWISLAMLIGALVVPLVVGIATLFVVPGDQRPKGRALIVQVFRGYLLCPALAVILVILAAVGLARFVHHLAIRWSDEHVPIVVRPGTYEDVVRDLERALDDAGLDVTERAAPAILAVPGKLIGRIAGEGVDALVPDRPVELVGEDLEVGLYPSDISIAGKKERIARARAALATRLTATSASLTTSAEAQAVETDITSLARRAAEGAAGEAEIRTTLEDIDRRLAEIAIPHDEWEVLYRERLQVERDLLTGRRPGHVPPGEGTALLRATPRVVAGSMRPVDVAFAGLAAGLVVADLIAAFLDWRARRR